MSATPVTAAAAAAATAAGGQGLRVAVVTVCGVAALLAGVRWLRVAQREHYLTGAATRFALRWWGGSAPINLLALAVALAGIVAGARWSAAAVATAVVVGAGPVGLGVRGRTSALAWTRRLRTLAAVWAVLEAGAVAAGAVAGVGPLVAATAALWTPLFVDAACAVTAPLERRLADVHVARAAARLRRVHPRVVAVTGSYGKTSTKGYVAHLVSGTLAVVASPASFNNRAGLARAVNEHVAEGTDVFVAEMGTYGRGEIAELCSWVHPEIAVITAIGPVHMERFGSEDRIVAAKAEILEGASSAVLVVDDARLAAMADARASTGQEVWRVSGRDRDAAVAVVEESQGLSLYVHGERLAESVALAAQPGNVAAAVAVALALGVRPQDVAGRMSTLPSPPHRLARSAAAGGVVVLDDTYNANPAGGRAALAALARAGAGAQRRVLVTPGMVELGRIQPDENARFARAAAAVATDVVVVGWTNRRALLAALRSAGRDERDGPTATGPATGGGAAATPAPVRVVAVRTRPQATAWVRAQLGSGDVVLYENDLPDHYP